jgi:phage anti-repressor protein
MMDKPQHVKDRLDSLHECLRIEKERYMRSIQPIMENIAFIENCYPEPLIVTEEMLVALGLKEKDIK